jgi:hypothetical protein
MFEWITPILSVGGALIGGFVGVKVGLTRQEERHMALRDSFKEHAGTVNERLKVIGERSHDHAQRIHEHGLLLKELTDRMARFERKGGGG